MVLLKMFLGGQGQKYGQFVHNLGKEFVEGMNGDVGEERKV